MIDLLFTGLALVMAGCAVLLGFLAGIAFRNEQIDREHRGGAG